METCVFCRIVARQAPAKIVYEDDLVVAFEDLHPQAPVHILIVTRKHLISLKDATAEDEPLLGRLFIVAARLARERGLEGKGYRTVINNGSWAGQSVFHIHVHLLGGRVFRWPPG
ncbi:MAG TPA: histidine triad nucleotide-binding protein [Terriglobia bacterium]|jgi:histidine triad (HIT) family protein|nr:histidine triad nucleotide-binding protein [Terriglobia bacterium]